MAHALDVRLNRVKTVFQDLQSQHLSCRGCTDSNGVLYLEELLHEVWRTNNETDTPTTHAEVFGEATKCHDSVSSIAP